MRAMSRGRLVSAGVTLALACALTGVAHADTPSIPDGYSLVDVITDNGFETSTQRFAPFYPADGSVSRSTVSPISGAASLRVHVNAYGRVGLVQQYGYGSGPIADSVSVAAKVRVDSTSPAGRQLQ